MLARYSKRMRPAFTIIEILISVLIISVSIIYVLKIHSGNREQIIYISERNKRSLSDSLFLDRTVLRYHKDKKNAYEMLQREVKIKELKSREILKKEEREIFIPEEIVIVPPPDVPGASAIVNEVKLKGEHSSSYWHFKITHF